MTATEIQAIRFFVPGTPKTAGSKRAFVPKGWKRPVIVDNCNNRDWKADVKAFALKAFKAERLFDGPLEVTFIFHIARPGGHYRTGKHAGNVRDSAPSWPTQRPDALKLARCVEDSLTGIIWRDDAQIVIEHLRKEYHSMPGVMIEIKPLPTLSPEMPQPDEVRELFK